MLSVLRLHRCFAKIQETRCPNPKTPESPRSFRTNMSARPERIGGRTHLRASEAHCRSYSPLPVFLRTVNPAFLASVTDSGFSFIGELKLERSLRTGLLHAGQFVSGG